MPKRYVHLGRIRLDTTQGSMIRLEIALLMLLCVSQYLEIAAVNLFFAATVILVVLMMKRIEDCTLGLFVALPMFNLLNHQVGNISMYYLLVFVFWWRYLQHHHWRISKKKLLVLVALMAIRLTSGEIRDNLTWVVLFSVLVLTCREDFFDDHIEKIVFYMSITFILSSAFGYLMLEEGRSIYNRGYVWSEAGVATRFAGVIGDSVFYSQFCALMVAANLALGCYQKAYLKKSIFLSICITAFCILTYAKTGIFLILLVVISFIFWQFWSNARTRKRAVYAVVIVGVVLCALGGLAYYIATHMDSEVVRSYLLRLTSVDLLTGRREIWAHYLGLLGDSWRTLFLAMPWDDFALGFLSADGRVYTKTHNLYLETVCAFGLVASVGMLLWVLVNMLRSFKRRDGVLCLMPICVILASGYALHGHFEFHYYTLVAIAAAFLSGKVGKTLAQQSVEGTQALSPIEDGDIDAIAKPPNGEQE